MSDQTAFETRLSASVKLMAANADGPVDASRIAAAALGASRRTGWWPANGLPTFSTQPLFAALLAIVAVASIGLALYWQRGNVVGPPAATATPDPSPAATTAPTPSPAATAPSPSAPWPTYPPGTLPPGSEIVHGWPSTSQNPPGLYTWAGRNGDSSHLEGFMHNGYGSGDVAIRISAVAASACLDGASGVTVAGHSATYRQGDPRQGDWAVDLPLDNDFGAAEEWIVEIDGTCVAIHLTARQGTSQADLDDAHGIIESMRYEPRRYGRPGFGRLVFRITNDEWDSG